MKYLTYAVTGLCGGELGYGLARGDLGAIFLGGFFGLAIIGTNAFRSWREAHPINEQ